MSQLKISADTSSARKSILDIGKSISSLKGSKVQVFSKEDVKFIKGEASRELKNIGEKLKENKQRTEQLIERQSKMVEGSKEELKIRDRILKKYKEQAKLQREAAQIQKTQDTVSTNPGGLMNTLKGYLKKVPALAAAATIGYAVHRGVQGASQFKSGMSDRVRLRGLGVDDMSMGSPEAMAKAGVTEQELIQRRIESTALLGRQGNSNKDELSRAAFERAFGLDGGKMISVAGSFRSQLGGQGASDAQMKLQSSILAAGIEDAIGPYLDSAVSLLTSINDSGMNNISEMTSLFATLTKSGLRTPEMIAKTFTGMDASVRGSSGESNAFLQTAFARAGIGGGTLGGTKFALSSGGIMGLSKEELLKRGYNKDLISNMETSGMFSGVNDRTSAILDMVKSSGGLQPGESISSITDSDRMVGLANLSNNIFGTKGNQGFDALMLLEQVQKGTLSQKEFDNKLQNLKGENDPMLQRLGDINTSLAGQTQVLNLIYSNLLENLGKESVKVDNIKTAADNIGVKGTTNVIGAVNDTGVTEGTSEILSSSLDTLVGGKVGGQIYDAISGSNVNKKRSQITSTQGVIDFAKSRRDAGKGFVGMSDEQIEAKVRASLSKQSPVDAKEIGKEVAKALKEAPITNTNINRIQLPDGNVTNRVGK